MLVKGLDTMTLTLDGDISLKKEDYKLLKPYDICLPKNKLIQSDSLSLSIEIVSVLFAGKKSLVAKKSGLFAISSCCVCIGSLTSASLKTRI